MLDEVNNPFCVTTFDRVMFDTRDARQLALFVEVLEHIGKVYDKKKALLEKTRPEDRARLPPLTADQVFLNSYKWFVGSGRVILFTAKLTSAYKKEITSGSGYFNLEFYNKEYRRTLEFYHGRGLSIEIHMFGQLVDLGDIYPLCSRTGGAFYYYEDFKLEE